MVRRRRYYSPYPSTVARETTGGIKARSKRGAFAESWWAKRWIEVLEGFDIGARLGRGRSYARKGQVTDIQVSKGKVEGRVQGSRRAPYRVGIEVRQLTEKEWQRVGEALSTRASFAAGLLAGTMPHSIGEVFEQAGLSLFPNRGNDLETDCSCPDWSNPCKHVAAVYYLLGEAFDSDPFLIFKLRGLDREELSALIGEAPKREKKPVLPPEPLPEDPAVFWGASPDPSVMVLETTRPAMDAALPKRLGTFPFWRGEVAFLEAMGTHYAGATPVGLEIAAAGELSAEADTAT